MKKGFSLVELLVSIIVIACITAAFVPLITKKFSSNVFGIGGDGGYTTDCKDKFGPNCIFCSSNRCIDCDLTCPDGQYKDTNSCTCKDCKDKYGEDCEKCTEKKCLTCPEGQYLDSDDNCQSCSDKFSNCATCTESECTSCANGYVLTDPTSSTPCSPFRCSGEDFIQIGSLCVTKKNMGDGDSLTIPNGVNVVNVGTTCNSSETNFCCWQGATSGTSCDSSNGEAYSGCDRTVCDWWAADYICSNFGAGNYTWRLATKDEMENWRFCSHNKGATGIQLCDCLKGYSSSWCDESDSCLGAKAQCKPSSVWGEITSGSSNWASSYQIMYDSRWWGNYFERNNAFSVRCVTNVPRDCAQQAGDKCLACDGTSCLVCDTGYIPINGKCEVDCVYKYGDGCAECNESACTSCKNGYVMSSAPSSSNACITECQAVLVKNTFCSGPYLMGVCTKDNTPLCVTRMNMGDSASLPIPSGVNIVQAGQNCSASSTNKCCWQGATSGTDCDSVDGGAYSGCNRTVCDWYAADYICSNFTAGGKTWRLPTSDEMYNWDDNSKKLASDGLQLCSTKSSTGSYSKCNSADRCPGSYNGLCRPYYLWGITWSASSLADCYYLTGPSWYKYVENRTSPLSVRCVTEL